MCAKVHVNGLANFKCLVTKRVMFDTKFGHGFCGVSKLRCN